jgi:hypothetical protein
VILDNYGPLDCALAKTFGARGEMLYLSTSVSGKTATPARIENCVSNGMPFAFVFENTGADMEGGAFAGYRNAAAAVWEIYSLFHQVGLPDPSGSGLGCYFADDQNPMPSGTGAYMKAAAPVLQAHGLQAGFYGNETGAGFLLSLGVVTLGWGVATWDHQSRVLCNLQQEPNLPQLDIGGTICDQNTQLKRDWGQWPRV